MKRTTHEIESKGRAKRIEAKFDNEGRLMGSVYLMSPGNKPLEFSNLSEVTELIDLLQNFLKEVQENTQQERK